MPFRPKLRTLLLAVNLVVLLLPLGGIATLRLYESELVKQTESSLISQAALVASAFRRELLKQISIHEEQVGGVDLSFYGNPIIVPSPMVSNDLYTPIPPSLDLATAMIREPAEEAKEPIVLPYPLAVAAGEAIMPVILSAKKITLSGTRVVDHHGNVVASSGTEMGMSLLEREEVARALKGEPVSLLRQRIPDEPPPPLKSISRGTLVRVFVALPVIEQNQVLGAVIISRTPLDVMKALYLIRHHLIKGGLVLVLVVLVISTLTTLAINRPVKSLIQQADRVRRGDKGAATPLKNPVTQEVAHLSEAIARMAKTLEDRAEYIGTFASNVSHEFKTPLASLRGSIELLRDHFQEMTGEERENFLRIIEEDTERLDRLVRRLLELARADVLKPGTEITDIKAVSEHLAERYRSNGLHVTVHHGHGVGTIRMARETFESIMTNLLENALQHNGEGTRVTIKTSFLHSTPGHDKSLSIVLKDNGKGISKANAEKIFRPFFTTARDSGGSGLGLSIVKSLVEAHNGTIEMVPSDEGACFKLALVIEN
jgi:signal transduction histidine kinase